MFDETLRFRSTGVIFDTFLKFNIDMNTSTNRMKHWSFELKFRVDETTYIECKCCKISPWESLCSLGLRAQIFQKVMDDVESEVFARRAGQVGELKESASHHSYSQLYLALEWATYFYELSRMIYFSKKFAFWTWNVRRKFREDFHMFETTTLSGGTPSTRCPPGVLEQRSFMYCKMSENL